MFRWAPAELPGAHPQGLELLERTGTVWGNQTLLHWQQCQCFSRFLRTWDVYSTIWGARRLAMWLWSEGSPIAWVWNPALPLGSRVSLLRLLTSLELEVQTVVVCTSKQFRLKVCFVWWPVLSMGTAVLSLCMHVPRTQVSGSVGFRMDDWVAAITEDMVPMNGENKVP